MHRRWLRLSHAQHMLLPLPLSSRTPRSMAAKPAAPLIMKLLVDTKAGRVLYAEAGKDVVDFLFSLLDLQLGAVTKLLAAGAMVGSVGNIHRSVETLDAVHRHGGVDALLVPAGYRCKGCSCSPRCYDFASSASGTPCPMCKGKMTTEVQLVEPAGDHGSGATLAGEGSGGGSTGYVRDMVTTYTVMDDLSVAPMSTICAVTALATLGVTDITGLQSKTVEIGCKEVIPFPYF
ncbi:hypothetical protein HU200_031200 [Digitaria exilis]|uniref:Uncharacterized protein n=1 Tax=Digitaria exilis TaxID=1010633 RepID=A0A835ETC1_9POAL|nr:hypothetical protein HU200_031200 [Digitaria exilis]